MKKENFTEFSSKAPNANFPQVSDVAPEELREKKATVKIVDVRRPDEWVGEFGHIPEAEHIVLDTLPERIHELPKDRTLVFICRSGQRSPRAAAFALENGFQSVYNMAGGMLEWNRRNFEAAERNGG